MTSVTVVVPMTIRRRGGRKQIFGPDGAPVRAGQDRPGVETTSGDPALLKALARAFRWRRMLEDGRYASIRELAAAEGVDRSYVARLLKLTLLAPDIVEAVLDGRQPEGLGLPTLLAGSPTGWEQRQSALCAQRQR
ncbi:hypothetical protein [Neoroseomonas soli]|uniref:LacI family transcriptional regulator n=1 Tax=Neoroseomonas soli TaxID=1081025 RepID=A0A9X9WS04_9PROT|nr:hypothetical protein [Neoroseomonas soli]MBR0669933.1 hypothetical protein [Neoroseomonas soli]